MGNSCSCKVIPEDIQLPAPQEELATSSKVVPKKTLYCKTKRNRRRCKPSRDSGRSAAEPGGAAGSSSSSAEVAPVEKPAGFINTKDSRSSETETVYLMDKSCGPAGEMNILEENSVESEMNADDHEEDDSGSSTESESIDPSDQGYISDIDETEDTTDTSSDSLESEHSPDVLSDKDQMKTAPKEETNTSPTKVQSRKCRWIRSVMRRLRLWNTKSSCIRPQTSTVCMIEKACNTSKDMFPDNEVMDDNIENELSPEASLNCEDRELCEEDRMKTFQEAEEPGLVAVQSRKHRYIVAALKKLGVRCCITERNAERTESLMVTTAEKACSAADGLNVVDDITEDDLTYERNSIGDNEFTDSEDDVASIISTSNSGHTDDSAEQREGPFGPPRHAWV